MRKAKKNAVTAKFTQRVQKGQKTFKSFYSMEPLPATFTLISILGLIITTVFTVSGRIDLSWGVSFDLIFALMFIASMMSITPSYD